MATLVPCLVLLRATFNYLYPGRGDASDGWIGDARHQREKSDHNPDRRGLVHAIDVDNDLGEGADMQDVVDFLVGRCRSGAEKRLTYVIYNRRIASASHGWVWRPYDGASPHTEHAHFSASSTPALERNATSWHLEEVPVALTAADKEWLADRIDAAATAAAERVWATRIPDFADGKNPHRELTAATWVGYSDSRRNDAVKAAKEAGDRVIAALGPS